jgi:transcriptional regulator with XRE-family HTH domain
MLREARAHARLTQRQLAEKSGIPQETIARIERGRSDPRVNTLDRLLAACAFGLEVMPRLGIGVDRTQIQERIRASVDRRIAIAMADDRNFAAFRRAWRRVAE